ncbi:hypothetical protein AB0G20_17300 [Streptomyces sp. NPDC024017]|uniref:hypothetical protein n=1 Tax=Streptomyces sp. NPDC024017 TaxID=3154326 RepID=UPI0033FEF028
MSKPYDRYDQAALALLSDLQGWRLRAIERVVLSSALWSERDREIHVKPMTEVMGEIDLRNRGCDWRRVLARHRTPDGNLELVLPIAELPKIPLLDLTITVAGNPVYRITKDEGARIEAGHVIHLGKIAGLIPQATPVHLLDFLASLFYCPSHAYQAVWEKYHRFSMENFDAWMESAIHDAQHEYLMSEWRQFPFDIARHYSEWQALAQRIGTVARRHVVPDCLSGAENPLIALPHLFREIREQGREPERIIGSPDIQLLLGLLCVAVEEADARAHRGDPDAAKFISAYFGYGYRWMAFAKCSIPTDKPFTISMKEKRAIYFSPNSRRRLSLLEYWRKEAWQMVAFADAETNHVVVTISDTAVRLKHRPIVKDEVGGTIRDSVDEEANTFELYLRYDSSRDRKERIYIKCPLRLTRIHSAMLWVTMVITAFGIYLLLSRGLPPIPEKPSKESLVSRGLTAKDATLILVPVAFAASFLLIRDTSTLSSFVRRIRQSILLFELFALLATAFILLAIYHIRVG